MSRQTVMLVSGVGLEELLQETRRILPSGWKQECGESGQTFEEIVFGPEAVSKLFDQSLVPPGYASNTLAISFNKIAALRLGERIPGAIKNTISRAAESLGGKVVTI